MPHIRLPRLLDEPRRSRGGGSPPPARDQQAHGASLEHQLAAAISLYSLRRGSRAPGLPPIPDAIQIVLRGVTASTGRPLLDATSVPKGWKLEIVEERQDGLIVAVSPDPQVQRLAEAIVSYRNDERTPTGKRKAGTTTLLSVDEVPSLDRSLRMGEDLAAIGDLVPGAYFMVDIELAAGTSHETGEQRRREFAQYLRDGGATVMGNGPILEEDYALFRARVPGQLLTDLLDVHPYVNFIDLPPIIEREAFELDSIDRPGLPSVEAPESESPAIVVLDGGVIPTHPLIEPALAGQHHQSFLPGNTSVLDGGTDGHCTAVVSVAAYGGLGETLLHHSGVIKPCRVAVARLLDDNTQLPHSVNLKSALPRAAAAMLDRNGARILNHSIASHAPFNRSRMSIWAEALDRLAYDNGQEGFLVIVATGNIDGDITPTYAQVEAWLHEQGHPLYLLEERCRLRNPAQAINALTVGAFVPRAGVAFTVRERTGSRTVADDQQPSPFTRTGFGYLREVKPEVVEEGGNWYVDRSGHLLTAPHITDVPVANSLYATEGKLLKFGNGTSLSAPRVAHLAAEILEVLPGASVDLVRALIVNAAEWPMQLATVEAALRTFGYGVPHRDRALLPAGPRCILIIEDEIQIGHAQYFRVPFPTDLFERNPETMVRLSVTLSYRAPIRKTNLKYRGTVLEWNLAKRQEGIEQFRARCSTLLAIPGDDDEEVPDQPVGDWGWMVGKRLRTRGTAQKDWFEAPASYFSDELLLGVIGRRGWLSKLQEQQGFIQRYAAAIAIEAVASVVPLHERIEALVNVPTQVRVRTGN